MAGDSSADGDQFLDDVPDILRRAREVDPNCDEAAVRRYVQEIAEVDALLQGLELDDALSVAPFSPAWNPERRR